MHNANTRANSRAYMKNTMQTTNQSNLLYGKIPPRILMLKKLYSELLCSKGKDYSVCDILNEQSFYLDSHRTIFKAIKELTIEGNPIDLLLVTRKLKAKGELDKVGGPAYITELTNKVVGAAHIDYHSRIIAQKAIARDIIRITSERGAQAYDDNADIDELLSSLQSDLIRLLNVGSQKESTIGDAISEIEVIIKRNQKNMGLTGIGTGLVKLDQFTGGLQRTDLIIIAGETSQGKTSFALTILKNAVLRFGARVAVYSLEMSMSQLTARILAQETNIPAKKILNKPLSGEEVNQVSCIGKKLYNLPVFSMNHPVQILIRYVLRLDA